MIEVTEKASEAIKTIMKERQMEGALRIFLNSGG